MNPRSGDDETFRGVAIRQSDLAKDRPFRYLEWLALLCAFVGCILVISAVFAPDRFVPPLDLTVSRKCLGERPADLSALDLFQGELPGVALPAETQWRSAEWRAGRGSDRDGDAQRAEAAGPKNPPQGW